MSFLNDIQCVLYIFMDNLLSLDHSKILSHADCNL